MQKGRKLVRVALVVYWILLFAITHLPPAELPKTRISDKLAHFVAYFILAGLLFLSMWAKRSALAIGIAALSIALVYGAADELTQPLVRRFCSIEDWLANAAGAVAATVIMMLAWRAFRLPSGNNP